MYLEVVTPEEVLLSGEVNSVSVPGVNGTFQMLNNHAPIVSLLQEGVVKIDGNVELSEVAEQKFTRDQNKRLNITINGGVVENKDNKTILLIE